MLAFADVRTPAIESSRSGPGSANYRIVSVAIGVVEPTTCGLARTLTSGIRGDIASTTFHAQRRARTETIRHADGRPDRDDSPGTPMLMVPTPVTATTPPDPVARLPHPSTKILVCIHDPSKRRVPTTPTTKPHSTPMPTASTTTRQGLLSLVRGGARCATSRHLAATVPAGRRSTAATHVDNGRTGGDVPTAYASSSPPTHRPNGQRAVRFVMLSGIRVILWRPCELNPVAR